ncbi:sigma-70 family RNA polymerase sigma factor [Sporosarcina koreensis]|uniref:Sigma-70 family RNA polymerase sigma factor n=1 Tax=Sporosarcina koreensis TaxID=334735 RepID=A0ABW0TXA9_9BACL
MIAIQSTLIEKAQSGDENAFYELLEPLQAQLYRIAFVYARNEDDAVDIFQQSVIRAYEGLPKLKEPKYFSTWLTRIVINCSKSYIEKNKRIELIDPNKFDNYEANSPSYVDEQLDLWQALSRLEEKYTTVLVLRYYQDLAVKEIALILDCPEGTVKTNIRRGLQALRRQLKGAYIDEWVQSIEGSD